MEIPQRRPPKKSLNLGIRLAIAAAVLVAVTILIFSLTKKNTSAPADPTVSTTAPTQAATETTEPTAPAKTVIHYAVAGDLNVNDRTVGAGDAAGYTNAFLDVAHLLAKADVASINFEGNLCGEPYGAGGSAPPGSGRGHGQNGHRSGADGQFLLHQ